MKPVKTYDGAVPPSALAAIKNYERDVNLALRSMKARTSYEPSTSETPLSILMEREPDQSVWEFEEIRSAIVRVLQWIGSGKNPHPDELLKRLFALGDHMGVEPYCLFSLREKDLLLCESHEAYRWRMMRLCVDPLMRKGCRNVKARGQKGTRASAAASRAQQGNRNRAKNRPNPQTQPAKQKARP